MADIEKTEFEFPDEVEEKNPRTGGRVVDPEPEVEIVDDTPPADRNRKPMEEPPKDVPEDELAKYDDGVRKRIQHFTKGYHDERRAKEAAQREREEAIAFANQVAEENKKLKGSLSQGQQALLEQAKKVVANEMDKARASYKAAYESGDSDALVKAQEELTAAKMKLDRVNNFKPAPVEAEEVRYKPKEQPVEYQQEQAPQVDKKAVEWQSKNTWFGQDDEMTSFALGLHNKLVKNGVDPSSEEYYKRVDSRMREVFPDSFESEKTDDAAPRRQQSSNVAPATRGTAPRKVVLTKSQVEIAKRLGVPLELYARKVAEEMRK